MTSVAPHDHDDPAAQVVVERIGPDNQSLRALATLRMTVFRSWPYLYDGSTDYETAYLSEFLSDPTAVLIVARIGDISVGMATASPLATQPNMMQRPFIAAGIDPGGIFYFGESVLLAQFRGTGIGHRFFDEREAAARSAGATHSAFCAVVRHDNHPGRPSDARDLSPFWHKRGYRIAPGIEADLGWKELGKAKEEPHRMCFWMKAL